MSKKKKITVAIIVLFLVIAIIGGIFAILMHRQTQQYNAVMAEVAQINELVGEEYTANIDREQLNALLARRVAGGKYGQVEDAYKNYMTDLYQSVYDATDASHDESFGTFLSAENLQSDGPEFKQSQAKVDELITRLQTDKEEYTAMMTDEAVDSYAARAGLDGRYREMYGIILSAHSSAAAAQENTFTDSIDATVANLNAVSDVFDFLSQNSENWYLQDGKLTFRTEALYNDYKALTENMN